MCSSDLPALCGQGTPVPLWGDRAGPARSDIRSPSLAQALLNRPSPAQRSRQPAEWVEHQIAWKRSMSAVARPVSAVDGPNHTVPQGLAERHEVHRDMTIMSCL